MHASECMSRNSKSPYGTTELRKRTPPEEARTFSVTTEQGCFEIKERLFHKHPSKVEAAERRRPQNTLQQATAAACQPQNAGRLASTTGLGTNVAVQDKYEKVRSPLVLVVAG